MKRDKPGQEFAPHLIAEDAPVAMDRLPTEDLSQQDLLVDERARRLAPLAWTVSPSRSP